MAKPSVEIIQIVRRTADKIDASKDYQWGHMGACNCGFLAQEVTRLSRGEIHRRALLGHGDWNEQLNDYCPTSGLLFDDVISSLLNAGFDSDDLRQLENLNNPDVLNELPGTHLRRNSREDAVRYLRAWADLLERRLLEKVNFPDFVEVNQARFAAV
jgi:hypothetical protein